MRISRATLFSGEAVTNTTAVSKSVALDSVVNFSISAEWTGTDIVGDIKLEASNDESAWHDLAETNKPVISVGGYLWNVIGSAYRYVRVSVTSRDANTISVDAVFYSKGPAS